MATGTGRNHPTNITFPEETQSGAGSATRKNDCNDDDGIRADRHFDREDGVNRDSGDSRSRATPSPTPSESNFEEASESSTQIPSFPCFIFPCPEPENVNYHAFEYMLCCRDPNNRNDGNMMRYNCCPLTLITIESEGKKSYSFEAARTESNMNKNEQEQAQYQQQPHYTQQPSYSYRQQHQHPYFPYHQQQYQQQPPRYFRYPSHPQYVHPRAFMPNLSFSVHNFNCPMPPHYNMPHYSCHNMPRMNYHCNFRNYQPGYMYPRHG